MPTDNSIVDRMRTWIGDRLIPHRHTALLVAINKFVGGAIALVGRHGVYGEAAIYSILVMLVLMVAVYTIQVDELLGDRELLVQQRRKRGFIGWALAIVAIVLRSGPIRFSKPQTSHGERTFPAAIFRLCRAYRAARKC